MKIKNYSHKYFALNCVCKSHSKHSCLRRFLLFLLSGLILSSCSTIQENVIIIQKQGSFAVGGSVIANPGTFDAIGRTPEGQTFHGDHAYIFYQVPKETRNLPLVFWHGIGQFSKTWETTPDGREGFQNIFRSEERRGG